jgi:hypothetical protein
VVLEKKKKNRKKKKPKKRNMQISQEPWLYAKQKGKYQNQREKSTAKLKRIK